MYLKASKSSCPGLASCFSEDCAGRYPPKLGQWGLDVSGRWAPGWHFSKLADVNTSGKQPIPHLYPIITTADDAPHLRFSQDSQSWAPNVNSATVIWLCTLDTLDLLHTLKFPTGTPAVLGSSDLCVSSYSWTYSLPTEYFWSRSLLIEITSQKAFSRTYSFHFPFKNSKKRRQIPQNSRNTGIVS